MGGSTRAPPEHFNFKVRVRYFWHRPVISRNTLNSAEPRYGIRNVVGVLGGGCCRGGWVVGIRILGLMGNPCTENKNNFKISKFLKLQRFKISNFLSFNISKLRKSMSCLMIDIDPRSNIFNKAMGNYNLNPRGDTTKSPRPALSAHPSWHPSPFPKLNRGVGAG